MGGDYYYKIGLMEPAAAADTHDIAPPRPKPLKAQEPALHMSGLPSDVTQNDIFQFFKGFADKISRISLTPGRGTSMYPESSKVSAIVIFYDVDDADRVLQTHKYIMFRDEEYCLTWHQQHFNPEMQQWNLIVENLPLNWRGSDMHDEFSLFGQVASCKTERTNGVSRGFGWV